MQWSSWNWLITMKYLPSPLNTGKMNMGLRGEDLCTRGAQFRRQKPQCCLSLGLGVVLHLTPLSLGHEGCNRVSARAVVLSPNAANVLG